eukprot:IDg4049t1
MVVQQEIVHFYQTHSLSHIAVILRVYTTASFATTATTPTPMRQEAETARDLLSETQKVWCNAETGRYRGLSLQQGVQPRAIVELTSRTAKPSCEPNNAETCYSTHRSPPAQDARTAACDHKLDAETPIEWKPSRPRLGASSHASGD